ARGAQRVADGREAATFAAAGGGSGMGARAEGGHSEESDGAREDRRPHPAASCLRAHPRAKTRAIDPERDEEPLGSRYAPRADEVREWDRPQELDEHRRAELELTYHGALRSKVSPPKYHTNAKAKPGMRKMWYFSS